MSKTVYILGAGCSAGVRPLSPGYPLASEFISTLEEFSNTLVENNQKRIKSCVDDTCGLLRQEAAQTVDALVARLASEVHDFSNGLNSQERQRREQQIRKAKLATAALFMALESKAKETGLPRYHNFMDELFGNATNWTQASRNSRESVLSFNYDRLFEMAFISRFKPDTGVHNLYGKSLLNSGLDYVNGSSIEVESGRFAFLKLHGSVGIRVRNEAYVNGPQHYTEHDGLPGSQAKPLNDELFFANASNPDPYERDPEPLIVFPHEKPFVAEGTETLLPFRTYIQGVWKQARRLVADATDIWAIGYRFAPMDREDVLGLLKSAENCKRLVIQNRPGTAESICQYLKLRWLEPVGLDLKVEAFPQPF